ncbi:MAG: Rho termination factor N-terminal domain-containing protein, partial [Firmicutes bacterium]|nr:Rho termination factor N-terminal domain-containing protein [Bacillota bacterium]
MDFELLRDKKVAELREIGKALHIEGAETMKKKDLLDILWQMSAEAEKQKAAPAEDVSPQQASPAEDSAEEAVPKVVRRGRPKKPVPVRPVITIEMTGMDDDDEDEAPAPAPAKEKASAAKAEPKTESSEEAAKEPKAPAAPAAAPGAALHKQAVPQESAAAEPTEKHGEKPAEETAEAPARPEGGEARSVRKPEPLKDGRYETSGILEIVDAGFGFLRFDNFLTSDQDVFVSPIQIRRFNLKTG